MATTILLGHHDVLLRLEREGDHSSFLDDEDGGQVNLAKAQAGGVAGGFFAVWVPRDLNEPDPDEETTETEDGYVTTLADPLDPDHALEMTMSMTEKLLSLEEDAQGSLVVVRSHDDLLNCLQNDIFASILHFEGAEAIDEQLSNLDQFYEMGLRSLGLVWSRPNLFGHGVQFCFPSSPDTGPGLTLAGRELVQACNSLGIMLDVSHLTEQGFWDVARLSRHPIVATHSNAHALCPSSRNLSDDQLKAIADSGGLVGLNFCVSDLRPDGSENSDTPMQLIIDQIDYMANLIGLEHIAIGSDFEGAMMPDDLDDCAQLSNLMGALADQGYDDEELEMIGHQNWLRVLGETWN